ncbi:unnamed protein product [Prorocentrum cordatum]|uniref:Uncharacterized protein n=1 Tax=Prorocentrum cordatum TaxID=2364126 RepID=A0ABN9RDT0_9DINO|nr:unnamed protein product [Polarella glacialis]
MASLKLRVPGDNVPVFSIYAPHNGKPYEERFNFYSELSSFLSSASGNGPKETLLAVQAIPHQAWISGRTLGLIDSRSGARRNGNLLRERALNTEVKRSIKKDRDQWLTSLLEKGPWDQVKDLHKGVHHRQGRLKNMLGRFVSSEDQAETLAEYVEKVQWAVRPLEPVLADTCLGPELDVDLRDISESEVVKTAARLEIRRAAGSDDLPPAEFWKQPVFNL